MCTVVYAGAGPFRSCPGSRVSHPPRDTGDETRHGEAHAHGGELTNNLMFCTCSQTTPTASTISISGKVWRGRFSFRLWTRSRPAGARGQLTCDNAHTHHSYMQARTQMGPLLSDIRTRHGYLPRLTQGFYFAVRAALSPCSCRTRLS